MLIHSAKNAADRPLTEEARKRNDGLREELLGLRGSQMKLSQEVDDLKKERQGVIEQVVRYVSDT